MQATFESMSLEELFAAADLIEANTDWSISECEDISIEDLDRDDVILSARLTLLGEDSGENEVNDLEAFEQQWLEEGSSYSDDDDQWEYGSSCLLQVNDVHPLQGEVERLRHEIAEANDKFDAKLCDLQDEIKSFFAELRQELGLVK